jgi:hypothetical protein
VDVNVKYLLASEDSTRWSRLVLHVIACSVEVFILQVVDPYFFP